MIAHSLGPYCPHKMSCVVPLLKVKLRIASEGVNYI